jgi:hypothetical protein
MFKTISGNLIEGLGSIAPTNIYNPEQLFGTGLTIWYDFNDTTSLFTDSAATINVANTGDYILYVKNKAKNRPNFDLRQANPSNLPLSAYTGAGKSVSTFNKSALNTNRNSNSVYHNASLNGQGFEMASISGYSTAGKSAFTVSGCFRVVTTNTATVKFSWQSNINATSFQNNNNTSLSLGILNTSLAGTIPINLTKSNGYFSFTMSIDSNKNGIAYINDYRIDTNVFSAVTYPLLASTSTFRPHFFQGTSFSTRSNVGAAIAEFCFDDGYAATETQIKQLHQYYATKYNLPMS